MVLRLTTGVLFLILCLLLALRTAPGRRALVHIALPIVNRSLAGHIQFSSLDGDLLHTIIVHDLKIDDAEGVQALYARRIEVHLQLDALWDHTLQIDELDVDGAQVLIRHLKDNRVNFGALPRSSSSSAAAAPSSSSSPSDPLRLVVKHLRLRFDGGYDPPRGHETHAEEKPRGSFDIEGSANIHGADVTVRVDRFISDARDPVAAHVELSGRLKVDPPRGPGGHTELTFSGVKVTVAADGSEIERIQPGLKAAGRWKVSVDGGGPLSGLKAHVLVEPPTGTLVADGTLQRTWPGVKWSARATARGIQPADDWRGVQPGHLDFEVAGEGDVAGGKLEVMRFDGATGDVRVRASGKSDFAGVGSAKVVASAGELGLSLTAQSDGRRLRSQVELHRTDGATASLELSAAPHREHERVNGADLVVAKLVASSGSRHFSLPAPAHLHLFGTTAAPALDGELAGLLLRLRGRSAPNEFTADVSVDAADLASLGQAGLGGRLHLSAHVVKGAQLRLDADLRGSGLRFATAHLGSLDAHVHTTDLLTGTARVAVERLSAPGVVVDKVALDVDGRTLSRSGRPYGGELTVQKLSVTAGAQSWALERAAHVRIDSLVTIDRFLLASTEQTLGVEGNYRPSSGAIELKVAAHDLQPASFTKVSSVREALSGTSVNGLIRVSGTVHAPNLQVSLKATSDKKVEWYGLSFNTLSLEASSGRESLLLHINAWGTGSGRLALEARGTPRWNGDQLLGAEVTLDRLRLSANEHVWQTSAPCKLRFDSAVTVEDCKLIAGKEQISIHGTVPLGDGAMDATLVTHELDLRELGAFLAPGHKEPPTTRFNLRVHASGTRQAPLLDLELRGHGSQIDEGLPENVDYRVRAHYGEGRVDGEVSARQLGTRLGIGARFDLPISFAQADDKPLRLELEARPVPFFKIRDSLPPAIAGLRGFFTLRVRASGTTRHPIFNVELHAPSWDLDDLSNNDTVVNLTYDGTLLRGNSVTSFAATSFLDSLLRIHPKRNSGTVKLELKMPVDISRLLAHPREALTALEHTAELTASAEVKGVELQRVPLQVLGVATPFTTGLIDGAMSMTGTIHEPSVHATLRATGLGKPGVLDQVDLDAAFAFENKVAQLSGKLDLRKHPLVTFKGEADLDAQKFFDGEQWKQGTIRGELKLPRFALSALRGMQPRLSRVSGTMWGKGFLRGTFGHPELAIEADAVDLELGGDRFEHAHVEARFRERRFGLRAEARQARGGTLAGEASWSRTVDDPFALSVRAKHVDIGFFASASEEVRSLVGELDAQLTIGGTRAAPKPEGFLTIHHARLGLRGKSEEYRNGALDVRMGDGRASLTLDVATGDGTLHASGEARVDGVQPTRLELTARARQFALVYGSFAARLDADFGLVGDRASGPGPLRSAQGGSQWIGRVDLRRGTINLPDLSGAEQVQPLGELSDVRFGDQRAERIAQPGGKGPRGAARIVGPLEIRGHEVNLDLKTDLAITVVPGKTTAVGLVEGTNGTVELFGRPYRLEAAEVRFNGPADDPTLHLRATRRSAEAKLIVTVSGTALNPLVALTVDPPLYDQAQLVGLVLAGSTRRDGDAISFHELNRQIGGILSGVILHKIKEQMAALLPTETFEPIDNTHQSRFALSPIEVGHYVSDRVYVSSEHQFGASIGRSAANSNESQIKVRLPHGGELDTAVGDAGVAGVYVYWSFRY